MKDWIAGVMAVLGVLLILSGGAVLVLRAMNTPDAAADEATAPVGTGRAGNRLVRSVRNLPAADRLIGWGVLLLVIAAIAAGAISFNFDLGANSGDRVVTTNTK
jgi:hypothetical protein